MKAIFLDFDGVINDIRCKEYVNKKYVEELKKVIKVTGAKVIVTSFNKNEFLGKEQVRKEETPCYYRYLNPLTEMGVELYDYTSYIKVDREVRRETEILNYLKQHAEIEEFVLIEDDYIMQTLYDHQVFIEYSDGFTSKYVEPTIEILNGNLGFYPPEYDRSETFEERANRLFPNSILEENRKDKKLEKLLKQVSL